jgi:hypothetical protein
MMDDNREIGFAGVIAFRRRTAKARSDGAALPCKPDREGGRQQQIHQQRSDCNPANGYSRRGLLHRTVPRT